MSENRLKAACELGQSIWYDNIQRGMMERGDFEKMIAEDDLRGVTSNPTIFDKAISKSDDYDKDILACSEKGLDAEAIYWHLVIQDIQRAADIFLPVYEKTNGLDGYISIEVSPLLARDTDGTVAQARDLYKRVNRKNVMVKVPATKEGIPAIRTLISEGMNINVTLIFSLERYKAVAEAYIAGLEAMQAKKGSIQGAVSVASFFVSRVDSAIDKLLVEKMNGADEVTQDALKALMGKAGIANSKVAYEAFEALFNSSHFEALKSKGGQLQRPLWASTSTKNPEYRDVMYVEALMGPNSVNTLPPATLEAFRDHGDAGDNIAKNLDEAKADLTALSQQGISLDKVTQELEDQGVESFSESFRQLLNHLAEKKEKLVVG